MEAYVSFTILPHLMPLLFMILKSHHLSIYMQSNVQQDQYTWDLSASKVQ